MRMLFVCIENSCRSQMAEAFARLLGAEAYSAGSAPGGSVNSKAIASMAELGYDLSVHTSKSVQALPAEVFDFVATLGCGDACPNVAARVRADWQIPDPKHMDAAAFAQVRDEIRQHVERAYALLSDADAKPGDL